MSHLTLFLIILGLLVLVGGSLLLQQRQAERSLTSGASAGSSAISHGNVDESVTGPKPARRP